MTKSIFISKDLRELALLPTFCKENSIALTAQSLIEFKAIDFEVKADFDALFFSSIRAFDFYTQVAKTEGKLLACIGESTAQRIEEKGYRLDFIGSTAGNPDLVAQEFRMWLGEQKVLIPISVQSNRSISKALNPSQFEEVMIYETISKSVIVAPQQHYIFTSPSNVESYLLKNSLPGSSKIIAWGKTTEQRLNIFGISPDVVLKTSTEKELVGILAQILK